jgi:hypothetical protein
MVLSIRFTRVFPRGATKILRRFLSMRRAIHGVILLVLTVATAGCGPELNQENLGQIQTTVEQLPGFGEPYPLPKPRYEADEETGETTDETPEQGSRPTSQ